MEPVAVIRFQHGIPLLPGPVHRKAVYQDFFLILTEHLEGSALQDIVRIPRFMLQ